MFQLTAHDLQLRVEHIGKREKGGNEIKKKKEEAERVEHCSGYCVRGLRRACGQKPASRVQIAVLSAAFMFQPGGSLADGADA